MSEYARRIFAFSAVAVILGISISVGIAFLPLGTTASSQTTRQPATLTSATMASSASTLTTSAMTVPGGLSSSSVTVVNTGTTVLNVSTVVTSVLSTTSTIASSSTAISSTVISSATSGAIPCSQVYPNGASPPDMPTIYAEQNSTAHLCVRYYYYNSTATETLNLDQQLYFSEFNDAKILSASSNFTVGESPRTVTLGGPANVNEGVLVVYSITPKLNSNGSYMLTIPGWLYPSFEACQPTLHIVVGNGQPDYLRDSGCTAPITQAYPVNPEGFVNGQTTIEIVGT